MSIAVSAPPQARNQKRRASVGSVSALTAKAVVLTICCAVVLIPFLSVVSTSLADQAQISKAGGFVLFPNNASLNAYRAIFNGGVVIHALWISVGITVVGTFLSLTCTTMLAYGLSRSGSFAHKPLLMIVLFTMLFSPGMIPNYLMIKELGLLDNYGSLILPSLISAFNVIVIRSFIMALPQDLIDSAKIDGAGELQVLWRIVLPLSKAVLAVIGLFFAVGYWNAFFNALLYMNDSNKWPLQLVLRTYVVQAQPIQSGDLQLSPEQLPPPQSLQMAILVISLVPILLVYPFLQRHFAKGVLVGAVKG
ncbi:MAG TPA: carbohydrate ABC transporter permease [Mycobacteriales bacterium]|nr:carbohydrate ABC transporter permease [Mycobacteriales bacterium]